MAEGLIEINDSEFETQVLNADKPVLVDFWAPWCGPCRAIAPIIEELAAAFEGKMIFAKCNVDDSPVTPGKYGIKAIPTLILFKDGQVAEQFVGMVAKAKIEEAIQKII